MTARKQSSHILFMDGGDRQVVSFMVTDSVGDVSFMVARELVSVEAEWDTPSFLIFLYK